MQTFVSSNFPVLTLNQIFMSIGHSHSPQTTNIWVRLTLRGLAAQRGSWWRKGGGGWGAWAVCLSQIRRQDKRQYWRFNACFAFGVCGCCNLLGKTRSCPLCLRHFGGGWRGLIDLGTDPPHAPSAPLSSPKPPTQMFAQRMKAKPECKKNPKRATMGTKRVEKPAGN